MIDIYSTILELKKKINSNKDLSDCHLHIYLGKFNNIFGTYNLSEEDFSNKLKKIKETNNNLTLTKHQYKNYVFYNLHLLVDENSKQNSNKRVVSINNKYSEIMNSDIYIEIGSIKDISLDNFPIIKDYHNIYIEKIESYRINSNKNYPIFVDFVEETNGEENEDPGNRIRYVRIRVDNINDVDHIGEEINFFS